MRNLTDHQSFILKPSQAHVGGVGVFALHGIVRGTKLVLHTNNYQQEVRSANDVPEPLQIYCTSLEDGTLRCPKYFNAMDVGNYLNHSTSPNACKEQDGTFFALRNIRAGEEILIDYRTLGEPESTWEDYYHIIKTTK